MKPFSIEVSNELDSEYIQKLAFKAGYKWTSISTPQSVMTWKIRYIGFNVNKRMDLTHGCKKEPNYVFPSQAEEIVKLFEKEKEPEFKKGDWVTVHTPFNGDNLAKKGNTFKIDKMFESLDKDLGMWLVSKDEENKASIKSVRPSSPSEIESHLINEAKEKGFVVGAKVKRQDKIYEIQKIELVTDETVHYFSCSIDEYFDKNGFHLAVRYNGSSVPLPECELLPSHPQITINGYTAKFEAWGLDFNNGCAKIDKDLFIALAKTRHESTGKGNKVITSVKMGSGEFTASQIKEIADYYNNK